MTTNTYISAKNKDNDTKLSGYDPWCLHSTSRMSWMTPDFSDSYISTKNKDNSTKHSGYDPWGLPSTSKMSWMTLSSISLIRNPQCPPSTPLLSGYLLWDKKKIMTSRITLSSMSLTLKGYLMVKQHHS